MDTAIKSRPEIALQPVKSSQIHAIGHDAPSGTLAIQFKSKAGSGSVYHYANFTGQDFEYFRTAQSLGSHFGKHIKPFVDRYPYTKVA
jgi:hypothetical protein